MSHANSNPIDHPEVQLASPGAYLVAYAAALGAMFLELWLVVAHVLSPISLTTAITVIALLVITVQMYLLFKLDLSKTQIWFTVSFIMTAPLIFMSIGLTIWMFITLMQRTMLPGM